MTQTAEALPDDPETLKAMLIAERQRAARLVAIIKELQRHRFGRRAESLPEDQLLLALQDVEQGEAGEAEAVETKSPTARAEGARKRRANRGALPAHLPRIESVAIVVETDIAITRIWVFPRNKKYRVATFCQPAHQ